MFQESEADLPVCSPYSVCAKVDTYGAPWMERQCRCGGQAASCSSSTHIHDGHTVHDRNKQYKVNSKYFFLSLDIFCLPKLQLASSSCHFDIIQ